MATTPAPSARHLCRTTTQTNPKSRKGRQNHAFLQFLPVQKYPRLQLRTVKELMDGKDIERPASLDDTFKKAPKAKGHDQDKMNL